MTNECHSSVLSTEESPTIIVGDSSSADRLHSEWHNCHSECSVSEMKNLNQKRKEDSSHSLWNDKWRPLWKAISFWKALPWKNSTQTSLLWDLSHTFEMTNMSFWKALLWRISRQARVQSPPLRIGRWRFLTLDHRSRLTLFSSFAPRLCPNKNVLYGTWLGVASTRHIFVQERQWKIFLYMYTLEDRRNNFDGGYCYIQE